VAIQARRLNKMDSRFRGNDNVGSSGFPLSQRFDNVDNIRFLVFRKGLTMLVVAGFSPSDIYRVRLLDF
jgi:hydrogenase maturation factor